MKKIFVCAFLTVMFSCKTDQKSKKEIEDFKNLENEFLDCFSLSLDKSGQGSSDEFFKYLKRIESLSIDMNYLSQTTKKDYIAFFKEIYSNANKSNTILEALEEKVPDFSNFGLTGVFFKNKKCLYDVMEAHPKSSFPRERIHYFEKLESSGFNDYDAYLEYINLINFKNEKDRLLLLSTLYGLLYQKSIE